MDQILDRFDAKLSKLDSKKQKSGYFGCFWISFLIFLAFYSDEIYKLQLSLFLSKNSKKKFNK